MSGNLNPAYNFCREVLKRHRWISEEESLTAHGNPVHLLSVYSRRAILAHLDTRHLLQQVFQHGILPNTEGRSIVNDRILLDGDGIAGGRDGGRINALRAFLHADGPEVHIPARRLIDVVHFGESIVPQQFGAQLIPSRGHFLQDHLTVFAR